MIVRDDTPEKVFAGAALRECAQETDELIREFWAWRAKLQWEIPLDQALEEWALKRWTSPLPHAALGILHEAAKRAERHGPPAENRARVPPRRIGEEALDYVHRIATINGWIKVGTPKLPRQMPEARLPYKDPRDPGEEG